MLDPEIKAGVRNEILESTSSFNPEVLNGIPPPPPILTS